MRILQLSNKNPFPPIDGGAIATLNITRGLVEAGKEVDLLVMNTSRHFKEKSSIKDPLLQKIRFYDIFVNTDIHLPGLLKNLLFSKKPYTASRFINTHYESFLIELLHKNSYDIVHLEGIYLYPYIPAIRKHSNAKIVLRAHNIEHEIWKRSAEKSKGPKRIYLKILTKRLYKFEKNAMNLYDGLVPITQRDLEQFEVLGNKKASQVSPTGISLQDINPGETPCEFPSIFQIGALDWPPNQEGLLWFIQNIWPKIKREIPGIKFYVAGRHAPDHFIKQLEKPGIVYLGEVDNAYSFMKSKSLMVVPLLSGSGMRIKIIEGMAMKKCIVSTSIGAEGIHCQNGKHIIIEDEPGKMADRIIELSKSLQKQNEIGENAFQFIHNHFDNSSIANKLIEFYKSLI